MHFFLLYFLIQFIDVYFADFYVGVSKEQAFIPTLTSQQPNYDVCTHHPGQQVTDTVRYTCDTSPMAGRTVVIQLAAGGNLTLCEVIVMATGMWHPPRFKIIQHWHIHLHFSSFLLFQYK